MADAFAGVIVHFLCPLDRAKECPGGCLHMISEFLCDRVSGERSSWMGRLSHGDHPACAGGRRPGCWGSEWNERVEEEQVLSVLNLSHPSPPSLTHGYFWCSGFGAQTGTSLPPLPPQSLGFWIQTQLHHWLSWCSGSQITDHGT